MPLRIYKIVDSPCPERCSRTSPLAWEHIGFSGDFLWDQAAATAGRRRQLNFRRPRAALRMLPTCSATALSI
jgi:hypothetical protein